MIRLYNTLSKSVEKFTPLKDGKVSIYSCGPTVYDNVTIGNLRAYIASDTLNRVLELAGLEVLHAMNLTDVDDKTIARSLTDFPEDSREIALKKLTEIYELSFMKDIELIGNRVDRYKFIRASESIEIMQTLINSLLKDGYAYIADDGIYFSIEKYKKSGKTYGQLLELDSSNTSKERINNDEYDKDSVHDFALWKFMKPNEPAWSYIIDGKDYLGRPGWHIECSAMSTSLLGQPIDIHTGGVDLIFPHHENEIAQSTAGKKDPIFAKYFVHNEHVLVDNRKISKSLGNGITVGELVERGFDPLAYRLLVLQGHYRSQTEFTWKLMEAAQSRLNKLKNLSELRWQSIKGVDDHQIAIKDVMTDIRNFAEDDMNTPKILAAVSVLQNQLEYTVLSMEESEQLTELLKLLDQVLGLKLLSINDIGDKEKVLLKERQTARDQKDWSKSDELRQKLLDVGIAINDTSDGQVWYRSYEA